MKARPVLYLVDDDEDDRMLLGEAVRNNMSAITIIECKDGVDFLEKLELQKSISNSVLVLIVMNMPRMTGLETISQLKHNPN